MQIPPLSKSLHQIEDFTAVVFERRNYQNDVISTASHDIVFLGVYPTPAAVALLQIQIKLVVPLQQSQKTREGWPLLPNWIASLMLQFLI